MNDIYHALARTALLIEADIFPGTDHKVIIDGLRATTARIISDRANIASPAGQTALVTLYALLAMLGLQIDLDVPAAGLATDQPPLRGSDLLGGLLDYSADLLPGGSAQPSPIPDVTFALGDTPAPPGAVRISGTGWTGTAGLLAPALRWQSLWPAGAMAAAAAAAAEGLRAAVPRIAERAGRPAPTDPRWRTIPDRQIVLDLGHYRTDGPIRLGAVDVISGGAITNAALYVLLRMPAVTAAMRIIEPDLLDLPNLNRYALARRSMTGWPKTRALEAFQTPAITIIGHDDFFNDTTAADLAPIAPRLLVGVDHIPSRWDAQRAAGPGWVCAGSSSHDFVLVSAHPAGSACTGCVHPRDENIAGDIPTISFVSFWAGLVQALELVASATGQAPTWARSTHVWPLGLDNPRGISPFRQDAFVRCPVGCGASAALQPGTGTEVRVAASRLAAGPYTAAWPRMTKSTTPCAFCGTTGSLSTEHVVPKWVRKALQIGEPVKEFSGTTYVGAAEALAIVFHEVCTNCNSGWMEHLETAARPALEPLILGAAAGTTHVLDPDQQATLATWAVKTALLLTLGKFRGREHGWIPASTLQWLHQHHNSRMPPPGTRVWMGGFNTSNIPASVQTACLYDADRDPVAECVTFTVGCVLFQVFATMQEAADLAPDTDAWLAPKGPYAPALVQIAPSSSPLRWPPETVVDAGDREALAARLSRGLLLRP